MQIASSIFYEETVQHLTLAAHRMQEEQWGKKSTVEEVYFFAVCYDGQVQTCKEIK
jgi:hypothetical protein